MNLHIVKVILKKEIKTHFATKMNRAFTLLLAAMFTWFSVHNLANGVAGTLGNLASQLEETLLFTLIIPTFISSDLAIFAFVREKSEKTLEHLLSLSISDNDIFLGKFSAAFVTGLLVEWLIALIVAASPVAFLRLAPDFSYVSVNALLILFLIAPLATALVNLLITFMSTRGSIQSRGTIIFIVTLPFSAVILGVSRSYPQLPLPHTVFNLLLALALFVAVVVVYALVMKKFSREQLISGL